MSILGRVGRGRRRGRKNKLGKRARIFSDNIISFIFFNLFLLILLREKNNNSKIENDKTLGGEGGKEGGK
jgi:hypothetical protein